MALSERNTDCASSRAIIDLDAYARNLDVVRERVGPKPDIMAVCKADAYGHGLIPIARRAEAWGAAMIGVATLDEGVALREAGIAIPVAVLFQPAPEALSTVVEHALTLFVSDAATAEALSRIAEAANKTAKIHCQIDTGMGRQGFSAPTAIVDLRAVAQLAGIEIEGVCTHFPTAYIEDDDYTRAQFVRFQEIVAALKRADIPFQMAHCDNSPGAMFYPETALDLVRAGVMTYGVWPGETRPADCPLQPVMRWVTRVTQVRRHAAGDGIGYGRSFVAERPTTVAVLSIGYGDGYPFRLGNRAEVLLHGQRCQVLGRVCMDQTVVDITNVPNVTAGDTAIVLGRDGDENITAEELAAHAGTIPYEIVTGVGRRVPREYLNDSA